MIPAPVVFVDYFCGMGGMSQGAKWAGLEAARRLSGGRSRFALGVAINHWDTALKFHEANNPGAVHWKECLIGFDHRIFGPARGEPGMVDILMAAPACQGHSPAARPARKLGKVKVRHDLLRATAWSVARAARDMAPRALIVENVPSFLAWDEERRTVPGVREFDAWFAAIEACGYRGKVHTLLASDFGVPQLRKRVFITFVSSGEDVIVEPTTPGLRLPASTCIDLELEDPSWAARAGMWKPISETRSPKALARRLDAHRRYPAGVIVSDFGHDAVHCLFTQSLRTITCKSGGQTKVIRPDGMMRRMLPIELALGMGFTADFKLPASTLGEADRLIGNAVCPPVVREIVAAVARAQEIQLAWAA